MDFQIINDNYNGNRRTKSQNKLICDFNQMIQIAFFLSYFIHEMLLQDGKFLK
jgi:hypothetical protein